MKRIRKKKYIFKLTIIFTVILFMTIGYAGVCTVLDLNGNVSIGFNFDDVNIYIANLYSNNINRFNSISEDKTEFNLELENGINNIDVYITNNSTQYDEYISFQCNIDELDGVILKTDENEDNNIVYSQIVKKKTLVFSNSKGNQTVKCKLNNLEVESSSKTNQRKKVIFAADGFENETAFKYIDSMTYGELPILNFENYEFLGWFNSSDELIESLSQINTFSDEVLTAKLQMLECPYKDGTVWTFDYTGGEQNFVVPCKGEYKLETWGAQGGNANTTYIGGYGGYSVGLLELESRNLFINVGGKGNVSSQSNNVLGGYNGGGASGYITSSGFTYGSGGGATHISLESGVLSDLSKYSLNNNSPIIIVAGGGGGGGYRPTNPIVAGIGGSGGGYIGQNGTGVNWAGQGTGGNQSSGGYTMTESTYIATFGKGGERPQNAFSGGGGGYFGGGAGDWTGAGGGSGYIGNTSLTDKVMYCYNCEESNEESTKTVSTTCTNVTPTENCAKQGNGYARITLVSAKYPKVEINITGSNVTLSKNKIDNYYEENEFTVTPAKGYYLSDITCSDGISASEYRTGINEFGTQTITLNKTESISSATCIVKTELLCRITSGTGTNIGDVVTCGDQSFHIYNIESDSIKALAKYQLNVGGVYNRNSGVFTPFENPTGIQETQYYVFPNCSGATQFSNTSSAYSGSVVETYVSGYGRYLRSVNVEFNWVSLLQKSEVDTLFGKNHGTEALSHSNYRSWLNPVSYWLFTPASSTQVWLMGEDNSINGTYNYLGTVGNGGGTRFNHSPFVVRPTISIDKNMIKY